MSLWKFAFSSKIPLQQLVKQRFQILCFFLTYWLICLDKIIQFSGCSNPLFLGKLSLSVFFFFVCQCELHGACSQVDQTAVSLEIRQAQEVFSCKGKMKTSVAIPRKFLL